MLTAVGVILVLAFVGWVIWRAAKKKQIKAHMVMYGLACVAGVFTLAFFFSMDVERIVKILVSIVLGAVLISLAAYFQRRQTLKTEKKEA